MHREQHYIRDRYRKSANLILPRTITAITRPQLYSWELWKAGGYPPQTGTPPLHTTAGISESHELCR